MTKKMFFGLMSASMLFATSCTNENELTSQAGDTAMVSFQIATPEMATRAYSDGTTATKLEYAVYDEDGNILNAFTAIDDKAETINLTTTVNFQLTTDNNYTVIFWASNAAAPYNFDPEAKTVTVDYTGVTSNNENYDAFFACETFTVTERVQVEEITLKRPFAQLNIGASDYETSALAGYTPTHSYVKVSNIYNTLNLWDGSVTNATEVAFNFADIKRDEVFPVAGYEYIAMNYLLVSKDKELVDIEFKYTDDAESINKENTKTRQIGSVPVQRNYRTNIYGDLLTSAVDVKVTIDPIYNDWSNDVFYAFEKGGEVTLTQNTEVAHTLYVRSGVNATLNLGGFTLTNNVKDQDDNTTNKTTDVIVVEEGATLTINGEGTIEAVSGFDGYAVIAEGTVIINGGTFKSGIDANGEPNAVIYARGNGKVYVNGGTFPNDNNTKFVLNKKDADRATTTIEVSGGLFQNFDPANNAAENAGTNFLAENCISIERGDNWYEVVSGAIVENADEFKAAYSNENLQYIIVAADLDFGTEFVSGVAGDKVILGNGYKFNAGGKTTKNYALGISNAVNVSINDLVMNGGGGIYVSNGANVEVNNVTLKIKYSASGRHMFYVNNAELTVNSGEYEVLNTGYSYFSMQNNGRAYVTGGTFADMLDTRVPVYTDSGAVLEISGGKFQVNYPRYKFDPTPYLATGYKAERVGDYMEVSAE